MNLILTAHFLLQQSVLANCCQGCCEQNGWRRFPAQGPVAVHVQLLGRPCSVAVVITQKWKNLLPALQLERTAKESLLLFMRQTRALVVNATLINVSLHQSSFTSFLSVMLLSQGTHTRNFSSNLGPKLNHLMIFFFCIVEIPDNLS